MNEEINRIVCEHFDITPEQVIASVNRMSPEESTKVEMQLAQLVLS
jgi:hypothetical protein